MKLSKPSLAAAAALAGLLGGTMNRVTAAPQTGQETGKPSKKATEKHACAGKNSCKGKGGCATDGSKENKAASAGVKEKHVCKGQNSCKGNGGCATNSK